MEKHGMHRYWMHDVFMFLGWVCVIVGIIGDVVNRVPGLEPTNWFLLAIGMFAASVVTAVMHMVDTMKK